MDYKTFYCKCGCNDAVAMCYEKYDDDSLSMSLVTDMFYTGGNGHIWKLKEKLKRIWYIITNKEYCYFEILMDKEDVDRFKKIISKF